MTLLPSIDFIQDRVGFCFAVLTLKVFTHPLNEVILKHSLNELVKQIWSDKLIDVGVGEVVSKRLESSEGTDQLIVRGRLTATVLTVPYVSHNTFGLNAALHALVCSADRNTEPGLSRSSAGDVQLSQVSHILPIYCIMAYRVHHPLTTPAIRTCSG